MTFKKNLTEKDLDIMENWDSLLPPKNADWDKQDDRYKDQVAQSVMNPATQTAPVYIPTQFIVPPKVESGEAWYVKLPGCARLQYVRILEVTEKTINLKDLESESLAKGRYKKTDIEFVEKA